MDINSSQPTNLTFNTTASGSASTTERMRIDSSGRVVIGSTTPMTDAALTLAGNEEVGLGFSRTLSGRYDAGILVQSGHIYFKGGADSGTLASLNHLMVLQSDGKVGIGTTSPGYELSINASDTVSVLQLTNTTTGSSASDGFLSYINGNDVILSNEENGYMRFQTNGLERMRIDSSGNVGIGTSTIAARLRIDTT